MPTQQEHKTTLGDLLGGKGQKALKTHVTAEADRMAAFFTKAKKRIQSNGVKYKSAQHRRDAIVKRVRVLLQRGQNERR